MRIAGLAVALFLLNASLTFQSAWPTPGVRWRGVLSIELAAFILALVVARRRLGAPSRRALWWCAAIWSVLVLGHYAEVTASALYGREINLFWDLRFVPDVAALLVQPERLWVILLAAAAALVVVVLLVQSDSLGSGPRRRRDGASTRTACDRRTGRDDGDALGGSAGQRGLSLSARVFQLR